MSRIKFTVIENHPGGTTGIGYYMKGCISRKALNEAIETYKATSKKYEMIGKKAMVVWY